MLEPVLPLLARVLGGGPYGLEALNVLLTQIPQKPRTIGLWLDDAAKLTITGLAFSLVFQARQFSMGVQGQVYMGAIASTYVALSPLGATWAGIPLGIAAAMLALSQSIASKRWHKACSAGLTAGRSASPENSTPRAIASVGCCASRR